MITTRNHNETNNTIMIIESPITRFRYYQMRQQKTELFSLQFCRLKEVGYTAEDVNR